MKVLCCHLRSQLPESWEYEFLDGEIECDAAKEVKGMFPGPYRCYYRMPTFENVEDAHSLLDEVLENEDFDALLGFSQGSALVASYLLHWQEAHPGEALPVKLAIFISASLPFSINDEHGKPVGEPRFPIAQPELYLQRAPDTLHARRWTPERDPTRLQLPTIHVLGKQDAFFTQGRDLAALCDGDESTVIEHREGHWIPQGEGMARKIANAIEGGLSC